jgi:VIT1/CCC1 family predicted Fe2+/Mn2+ transporter
MTQTEPLSPIDERRRRETAAHHIDVTRERVARRDRVREVIFGTQDGLLTTLGLVTAVGNASADRYTVLVAGMAGGLAGMIAMGAGAYISSKSQLEVHIAEVERERAELQRDPERELEELVQLFEKEGLPEDDARVVAEKISKRPTAMLAAMTEKEMGLSLEHNEPLKEGIVMGLAFLVGAVVPITPYVVASSARAATAVGLTLSPALVWSVSATIATLFLIGLGKSRLAHRSVLRGGLEVMLVGMGAAVVGFLLGTLLPNVLGAHVGA